MGEAMIGVTVIDDTGSMHVRAWPVPTALATELATALTGWFGDPDEMVSDRDTMQAEGAAAAANGHAVFLLAADGSTSG